MLQRIVFYLAVFPRHIDLSEGAGGTFACCLGGGTFVCHVVDSSLFQELLGREVGGGLSPCDAKLAS